MEIITIRKGLQLLGGDCLLYANLDPNQGTMNTSKFETYVEEHLVPVFGSFNRGKPRSIVIMDNASIHSSDRIEALIQETGACYTQLHAVQTLTLLLSSCLMCIKPDSSAIHTHRIW
jgi:hypothetical protein